MRAAASNSVRGAPGFARALALALAAAVWAVAILPRDARAEEPPAAPGPGTAPAVPAATDRPAAPDAPLATPSAPTTPTPDSVAGGTRVERVQVTDPYLELHTFPGRGYPIFHVAARGEWVAIELRHTDWYKVRTATGKEGWVHRSQLVSTLGEDGEPQRFADLTLHDYLQRRFEVGAAYGRFHSEPMDKFYASYRFTDTLSIESDFEQVQGTFSGTTLWNVNLQAEPWSDRRFSPFAGIGIGKFRNVPNRSLVQDLLTNVRMSDAVVGARWHVTDRLVLRADFTIYTAFASDSRTLEYHAATVGLGLFF
jgi:hypothetical protein